MASLAEVLTHRRERILRLWEARARALPKVGELPPAALVDHSSDRVAA